MRRLKWIFDWTKIFNLNLIWWDEGDETLKTDFDWTNIRLGEGTPKTDRDWPIRQGPRGPLMVSWPFDGSMYW